jgi:hypothetical protein
MPATTTYEPTNIAYLQNLDSYRPLHGKCLLRLHRHEQFTPGGLVVPEVARDLTIDNKSFFATVLKMTPRQFTGKSWHGEIVTCPICNYSRRADDGKSTYHWLTRGLDDGVVSMDCPSCGYTGKPGYPEGFGERDTVIVMLRLEDLSRKDGLLITSNTRVYAVVE